MALPTDIHPLFQFAGAAGFKGDVGDDIPQSLRITPDNQLHWDMASFAGTQNWTLSAWVKHTKANTGEVIIFHISHISNVPENFILSFNGGVPQVRNPGAGYQNFNTLNNPKKAFGDPYGWYHVFLDVVSNTVTLYVNGINWGTATYSTSGWDGVWTFGKETWNTLSSANAFDGYMADIVWSGTGFSTRHTIDKFGRTNAEGIWVPVRTESSALDFGSNGFRLEFNDSSALGTDTSGNGNNFTATGFNVGPADGDQDADDAAVDYMPGDTPTRNSAILNPVEPFAYGMQQSSGAMQVATDNGTYAKGYVFQPGDTGKYYIEIASNFQGTYAGGLSLTTDLQSGSFGNTNGLLQATTSGLAPTGYSPYGSTSLTSVSDPTNQRIGLGINLDDGQVEYYYNGVLTSTDTSAPLGTSKMILYIVASAASFNSGIPGIASGKRNGLETFNGRLPTGYKLLRTDQMTQPSVVKGYEHFKSVEWDGDGTASRTLTVGFQPDYIIIKSTSHGTSWMHFDSVRGFGASKELIIDQSGSTREEGNSSTDTAGNGYVSGVTDTGFTVSQGTSTANYSNASGRSYIALCWKAGGAHASQSVNREGGFSITKYTGNSTNRAIAHGLSQKPDWVMVKRVTAVENWFCTAPFTRLGIPGASGYTANYYLHPDGTYAITDGGDNIFRGTTYPDGPDDTNVYLGAHAGVNGSGDYIMYAWHSVTGYSSFGTYSGNSSTNGSYIETGFRPEFVLSKVTSTTDHWCHNSAACDPKNPREFTMRWNLYETRSQQTGLAQDFTSKGFKNRGTGQEINNSSWDYFYAAWGSTPFGGENLAPNTGGT